MELPVMDARSDPTPDLLVRAIKRSLLEVHTSAAQIVEPLEHATAYVTPNRPDVHDANFAGDIRLDPGASPEAVHDEVTEFFTAKGGTCWLWQSRDVVFPAPLARLLEQRGHQREAKAVLRLREYRPRPDRLRDDLQIVNARAVRREYQELRRREATAAYGAEVGSDLADFYLDTLDEPRLDILVARNPGVDGSAIACAGLLALGEVGVLWDVETRSDQRRSGVMLTLIHRVLELARRSRFHHVILETQADNEPALALYRSIGFEVVAHFDEYRRIDTRNG